MRALQDGIGWTLTMAGMDGVKRPQLSSSTGSNGQFHVLAAQKPIGFRMTDAPPLVTAEPSVIVAGQTSGAQKSKDFEST